jgi:hypothetical protein
VSLDKEPEQVCASYESEDSARDCEVRLHRKAIRLTVKLRADQNRAPKRQPFTDSSMLGDDFKAVPVLLP